MFAPLPSANIIHRSAQITRSYVTFPAMRSAVLEGTALHVLARRRGQKDAVLGTVIPIQNLVVVSARLLNLVRISLASLDSLTSLTLKTTLAVKTRRSSNLKILPLSSQLTVRMKTQSPRRMLPLRTRRT